MSSKAYEIAATVMSYWFAALMVYLLLRLVQSVWRDYAGDRVRRRQAEGYSMGMLEVIAPQTDTKGRPSPLYGARYALRRENLLGSARKCDIRLRERTVAAVQASIYQKGNQVLLSDYGARAGVFVNGHRMKKDLPLLDGDEIALGEVVLRLHIKGGTAANVRREGFEKETPRPAFEDEFYLGGAGTGGIPAFGAQQDSQPESRRFDPRQEPEEAEEPEEWEEDGGYGQRRAQRWERELTDEEEEGYEYGDEEEYEDETEEAGAYEEFEEEYEDEAYSEEDDDDGEEETAPGLRRHFFGRRDGR